jgi:tetratricopeptide (TPR) repeat protein
MRRSAFALMVLTAAVLSVCREPPGAGALRLGLQATEAGRWEEAVSRWKSALSANPLAAAVHNNLAVAYEKAGNREAAAAEYDTALKVDPFNIYIQGNRQRFDRGPWAASGTDGAQPGQNKEMPPGVTPIRVSLRNVPLIGGSCFKEIILTNFRLDQKPPEFDLDKALGDVLAAAIDLVFPGKLSRLTVAWDRDARFENEIYWRSAAAGRSEALFLTGSVRFTQESQKALRENEIPKDGPFKLDNRGLRERKYFRLVLECVLITSADGRIQFSRKFEEAKTYETVWQPPDAAFSDLSAVINLRLLPLLAARERVEVRYLLTR